MLQDIKCSTIVSFKIDLKYDDNRADKSVVIGVGDLVDVDFNYNGCRKQVQGRVLKLYAEGSDPKKWYILLDSADMYNSDTYKFSPMNILDITIIQKADALKFISSPSDYSNIRGMRIVQGQLQYTQDGSTWYPIWIDPQYIIEDENYGIGSGPRPCPHHKPNNADVISDEEF